MRDKDVILVVDDDESFREILAATLQNDGYGVLQAGSAAAALEALKGEGELSLLITDIRMPGMSGYDLVREAAVLRPGLPIVVLTAYGSIRGAVEAMRIGADNYVTKPFERRDLIAIVKETLRGGAGRAGRPPGGAEGRPIVESEGMKKIMELAGKAAASDATLLITGETGTGKEIVADLVHRGSGRDPFVKVNCSAIPRDLLESELFGHRRGAFTGAVQDKAGKFVEARGGTILLDEIGDMDTGLQAKLLRVLEERKVDVLGGGPVKVDVRVIASTNHRPEQLVEEGKMRQDLFFRLNVLRIDIPPLRERRDDIEPLARHFFLQAAGGARLEVDPGVFEALRLYAWPGNVRELRNLCERLVILRSGDSVTAGDLPKYIQSPDLPSSAGKQAFELGDAGVSLQEIEREIILQALEKNGWNQSATARYLNIPRHVLLYRMEKFGIEKK